MFKVLTGVFFCCVVFLGFADASTDQLPVGEGVLISQPTPVEPEGVEEVEDVGVSEDEAPEVSDEEESQEGTTSDPVDDDPSSAEQQLSERIQQIADEVRADEVGSGLTFSSTIGYADQGVDAVLPEHFFRGHIVSQGISAFHPAGFRLAVENLTSVSGGAFSDLGDRTILSVEVWRTFGSFYASLQHRWVHTNCGMESDFFYADRHRTKLQSGFSLGPLQLYAHVSSDVPAYTPVHEMVVYGGGGVDLNIPLSPLNTELCFGASIAGTAFWYHQSPRALCRFRAGIITDFGGFSVNPEATLIVDPISEEHLPTFSFNIAF
ncbi:MAG: hypothetical protein OXB96_02915 [Candidatus Kaiserbacteria bacterium]|nr:hypothetical protein [Candidatus Kaiserbacteria bacterium]